PGERPVAASAAARHTVISADGHAGASRLGYRDYLERRWHEDFDAWAEAFDETVTNAFADVGGSDRDRNWNSPRRLAELERDGVVAEVLYPNTIPPFSPADFSRDPTVQVAGTGARVSSGDVEARRAGLMAHNRWLVDFCDDAPGRRAGIAQVLLIDVAD